MFCVRCGRELPPEGAYCVYCGAPARREAPPQPASPLPPAVPSFPPTAPLLLARRSPPAVFRFVGLLALSVMFAVVLGGVAWVVSALGPATETASVDCTSEAIVELASPVAPSQRTGTEMEAAAKARQSVVLVTTPDGSGSGIILTADGYVLTNDHVVEGARKIELRLAGGQKLAATTLRTSKSPDLALLKASGKDLTPATWVDSDKLALGQTVLAIGHALDIAGEPTISRGIVSALRTRSGIKYVQTDATSNPGNSGGPIVDLDGDVVAVDTFGLEGATGLNFGIAASEVRRWLGECGD